MGLRGVAGWLLLAVAAGRAASEGVGALEEAVPRGARRQLVAGEARRRCVFHLHVPKCAGTFVWRFLKGRFCEDEARICGRETLEAPPACDCVVNPITRDGGVLAAIRGGGYAFTSAHSRSAFQASTACALAVWFREPVTRRAARASAGEPRRRVTRLKKLRGEEAPARPDAAQKFGPAASR